MIMKEKPLQNSLLYLIIVLLLTACCTIHKPYPEKLIAPLNKLTPAVQAVIAWPEESEPVPENRILEEGVKDKPELQEAFKGIPIKIKQYGKNVVILVCSPDGKNAWLEDASWTDGVDKEWYKNDPSHPCDFSLDPSLAP